MACRVSPSALVRPCLSVNAGIPDKTGTRAGNPLPTICNSSIKATLKTGSGLSGSVGCITSATFTNCRWVLGVNKTRELTFPGSGGNLHYYQDNGCAGLVASGDQANLHATYTVSPAQEITSP